METKPIELTKDEALSLSMAYRNQVNKFSLMFKDLGHKGIQREGKNFFNELNFLQDKLEKFIGSFSE